jgi:hypothetical protein
MTNWADYQQQLNSVALPENSRNLERLVERLLSRSRYFNMKSVDFLLSHLQRIYMGCAAHSQIEQQLSTDLSIQNFGNFASKMSKNC